MNLQVKNEFVVNGVTKSFRKVRDFFITFRVVSLPQPFGRKAISIALVIVVAA
jgi:hypothetical protein